MLDSGKDFTSMFDVISTILQRKRSTKLPDYGSSSELADRFATYFTSKIQTFRLTLASTASEPVEVQSLTSTLSWKKLNAVSETDIRDIIMKSPSASGILDPILWSYFPYIKYIGNDVGINHVMWSK